MRFIGELCEDCTIKNIRKIVPNVLNIEFCRHCKRLKVRGEYKEDNNKTLAESILAELNNKNYYSVKINSFDGKIADAYITYRINDDLVTFNTVFKIKKVHQICQECYRKSSGYYEALIQLRGDKERIDKILQKLDKFLLRRNAFISKIDALDHGVDVYVSDKLVLKTFFSSYRLKPKASYTLYGIKNGRKVYRNTYFLSFSEATS